MNKTLNYSTVLFVELVYKELVSALERKEDIKVLCDNLDRWCRNAFVDLHFDNIRNQTEPSPTQLFCRQKIDAMRRILHEAIKENSRIEDVVIRLTEDFGDIKADDYPVHATFFCQEFDLFPSFHSVWNSFSDDQQYHRTAVFVWENEKEDPVVTNYIDENYDNYHEIGVPVINHTEYDLGKDHPDICFYMKPYYAIRGLPSKLFVDRVNKQTPFTVFISYCLDVQGGNRLFNFFYGMPAFYSMWKIIGYSQFYMEMAKEYGFRRGENVQVIGHPKFDALYELLKNKQKWYNAKWSKKINNRPVVLWNTHFSVAPGEGVGTFLSWYKVVFDYIKKHHDIFLIWRPHPIFWQEIIHQIDSNEFNAMCEELEQMDNVIINRYGEYHYAFAMSDALISDAATFLIEYIPTGNPVMYTPKEGCEGVCDPKCVKELYIGDSEDSIISYLDMVRNGQDPKRDARLRNFEEDYGIIDGRNGIRIRDYIIDEMRKKIQSDAFSVVNGITGEGSLWAN